MPRNQPVAPGGFSASFALKYLLGAIIVTQVLSGVLAVVSFVAYAVRGSTGVAIAA
jgi:hypothetical protein